MTGLTVKRIKPSWELAGREVNLLKAEDPVKLRGRENNLLVEEGSCRRWEACRPYTN
jgi:hypothetical protein